MKAYKYNIHYTICNVSPTKVTAFYMLVHMGAHNLYFAHIFSCRYLCSEFNGIFHFTSYFFY